VTSGFIFIEVVHMSDSEILSPPQKMGACAVLETRSFGRLGGDAYTISNIGLFLSGAIAAQPHSVIGASMFLSSGIMFSARGDNDKWFAATTGIGCMAMIMTNYPTVIDALQTLQTNEPATLFGTVVLIAGGTFGALKPQLAPKFGHAKNVFVRNTLGKPRELMGALCASSRIFMIYDAIASLNKPYIAIFGGWLVGDCFMARSSQPRRSVTLDAPPRLDSAVIAQTQI
jgi:hypothetical protein